MQYSTSTLGSWNSYWLIVLFGACNVVVHHFFECSMAHSLGLSTACLGQDHLIVVAIEDIIVHYVLFFGGCTLFLDKPATMGVYSNDHTIPCDQACLWLFMSSRDSKVQFYVPDSYRQFFVGCFQRFRYQLLIFNIVNIVNQHLKQHSLLSIVVNTWWLSMILF